MTQTGAETKTTRTHKEDEDNIYEETEDEDDNEDKGEDRTKHPPNRDFAFLGTFRVHSKGISMSLIFGMLGAPQHCRVFCAEGGGQVVNIRQA